MSIGGPHEVLPSHAEVDDDFRIVSRFLNGVTIPFDSLSHRAKEQLGVISRLAVGMLVSDEGEVPIIIDDALGYADPKRLEGMSAVLQVAGRVCQVIVLTCVPDRYRHIGEMKLVPLDCPPASADVGSIHAINLGYFAGLPLTCPMGANGPEASPPTSGVAKELRARRRSRYHLKHRRKDRVQVSGPGSIECGV